MNCQFIEEHLFAFHERTLDDQGMHRYRGHLATCPSCKKLDEQFEASLNLLASPREITHNPFLTTRILQRLDSEFIQQTRTPAWIRILQPALLTVALVIGILIGSFTARKTESGSGITASTSIQEIRSELFIQSFTDELHVEEMSK